VSRGVVASTLFLGGGLVYAALTTQASESVSFKRDITPLLKVRCAVCHLIGEEPGNMALHPAAAYKTLVGVKSVESPLLRVKPGAADESYMIRKLEGTHIEAGGKGVRMPMDGDPLTDAQIHMIRAWINAGAPDN